MIDTHAQRGADMQRVRDQRQADLAQHPGQIYQPGIHDMEWDAFFGALQRQAQGAADAGGKYKVNWAGFGNSANPPSNPSIMGLQRAAGGY